ncbi:MAG: hypothetical protein ABI237_14060 [Ginsengibacter sp.]
MLFAFSAVGQVNDRNIQQQVLEKGIIDSVFVFGKWTEKSQTETQLKYLGKVTTKKGQTFKIMNSIWLWGLSKRATSRILIFNLKNQYVGNYYLSVTDQLPTSLRNGKLIFTNLSNGCDKKVITTINLNNGFPKQIFRKCNAKYGDTYRFEPD